MKAFALGALGAGALVTTAVLSAGGALWFLRWFNETTDRAYKDAVAAAGDPWKVLREQQPCGCHNGCKRCGGTGLVPRAG